VTYTRGFSLLARTDSNGTLFYHLDGNNNVTALVDANGTRKAHYTYDSFGNLIEKSGPMADANLYRFAAKEVHPLSGLYSYLYRFYDANLQRWLSKDPIGLRGGRNVFAFVGNSPISRIDPLGLDFNSSANYGLNDLYDDWGGNDDQVATKTHFVNDFLNPVIQIAFEEWGKFMATAIVSEVAGEALGAFLRPVAKFLKPLKGKCPTRFEGLTPAQMGTVQNAMKEAGMTDANILIKGADMPPNYAGMTLGDEGFALNRSIIDNPGELQKTLQHEYQHVLDRRALGDPGAYGQGLEDATHAAEGR